MPFADRNGQQLYYEETGSGSPALVFSHGLLLDREMFAPQVGFFQESHRCIAWDQRGHGKTVEDAEPFDYWDSAEDCLAIMNHAGIEQAVLIGLSQGGFLSLRAALSAPERIEGLVLIATQSGVDSDDVNDGFLELRAEWSANGPANAGADVAAMLLGDKDHATPWLEKWSSEPKSRLGPCIDTLIGRDDITARLHEITCPTLVIHGDADNAINQSLGIALANELTNNQGFVSVAGAAHAPTLTHADTVNSAISSFLQALRT